MKQVTMLAALLSLVVFSTAVSGTFHVYAEDTTSPNTTTSSSVSGTTLSGTAVPSGTQTTAAGGTTLTDTTAPTISDIRVENIITTGAQVRWNTDDPSLSGVTYSAGTGSYLVSNMRCDGDGLVTLHCVYVTNLMPGTQYYFNVISKNASGLIANIPGSSFRTAPLPTPTGTTNDGGTSYGDSSTAQIAPPPPSAQANPVLYPVIIGTIANTTTTSVPANTSGVRILEEPKALVPQPVAPSVKVISPVSSTVIVPPDILETPRTQLEDIGTSVRTFQDAVNTVNNSVQSAVTRDIERAVNTAMQSEQPLSAAGDHVFDPNERSARLEELKRAVSIKQRQLSKDVQKALTSSGPGENPLPNIEPVLKSSLDDISLIIKNETGVQVDLSPTARTVASDVQEQSSAFDSARQALSVRDGLDLYTDSDRDGISNYDESHIYHTDPHNAYTSGGSLTDGEKVVLGFDVSTSTIRRVPVESPMVSGEETRDVFEVYTIAVSKSPILPPSAASTSAGVPAALQATSPAGPVAAPSQQEKITFAGRALPNSFVTLYIYSTPIVVTVKTDISGAWKYTLDSELPDGNHNLYVATVDAGGKILAKSPAIPFVKTAEAADFTPLIVTQATAVDPLDILRNNMLIIGLAGLAVFSVLALGILGFRRVEQKNNDVAAA